MLHGADIQHNQDKPSCSLSYHRLHTLRIIIRCYSINTRTDTHLNNTICHDVNIPRTLAPPHIKRRLGARVTRQAKIRHHVSLSVIPNLTRIPRFQFKIFSSSAFSFSPNFVFLILPLPFFFSFPLKTLPYPNPYPLTTPRHRPKSRLTLGINNRSWESAITPPSRPFPLPPFPIPPARELFCILENRQKDLSTPAAPALVRFPCPCPVPLPLSLPPPSSPPLSFR